MSSPLLIRQVAGKSSNERHACMELYEYVKDRGIEPYSVMVTTADADSQFDKVFLEQVATYSHRLCTVIATGLPSACSRMSCL